MSCRYVQLIRIHTTYGHILRLNCLTFGNFSIVKIGYKQSDHILRTFNYLSEDECENQCKMYSLCKSINFKNNICELNRKSTEDPFDNAQLTQATGWAYKSTDYTETNVGSLLDLFKALGIIHPLRTTSKGEGGYLDLLRYCNLYVRLCHRALREY